MYVLTYFLFCFRSFSPLPSLILATCSFCRVPPLWSQENIKSQIIKPENYLIIIYVYFILFIIINYIIIKLVLSSTPEGGVTGLPKHVGKQNILKLKLFVVSYCDETVNSFKS